ncbi:MAG: alpha/beta hydrolase [Akkermansia sp.]|nr:alpha/beta hydrolase [Akkermansia sp.]
MKKHLLISVLITAFLCFVGWVFIPHRSLLAQCSGTDDAPYNREHREHYIHFETSDKETLTGWFFDRGEGKEIVICYPGNSCNAGMFIPFAMKDTNRSYLMLNYRGYGNSSGRLEENNMISDACEVIKAYSQRSGEAGISLLGFSLGTGVAVQVASKIEKLNRIVLVCPFDSMASICNLTGPKKYIVKDHFDSLSAAPLVQCPVYIIYGTEDTIVPPKNTYRLINALKKQPRITSVKAGHADAVGLPINQQIILQSINAPQ